jgi:hypothetical protein
MFDHKRWLDAERWERNDDGTWTSTRTGQVIQHATMLAALGFTGQTWGGGNTAFLPD